MKECVFCNIIKTGNNNNNEKEVVLYEDELILIIPAAGSPVRGYLMIIAKRHINGFAELSPEELKHVEDIVKNIKTFYKKYFKVSSILLEHGSTSQGRHSESIVHAHWHLIPFEFNEEIEGELFTKLQLNSIELIENIKLNKKLDYWLYCDTKGKYYTSSNILDAPRSIFMNLIAKQIKLSQPYEWRKSVTPQRYITEMVNIFDSNKNLIK